MSRQGEAVENRDVRRILWSWEGVSAVGGPIDDDLSFLLIKMAVSSWIEEVLIEACGHWCGN